jgi:hypothetical protein
MLQRGIIVAALLSLAGCDGRDDASVTTINAFYQGRLYSASYRELPSGGESASILYQSDAGVLGGAPFVAVLGGSLTPVWREIQVSGNQCSLNEVCAVPRQLTSAEDILAATDVHLVMTATGCSVVDLHAKSVASEVR